MKVMGTVLIGKFGLPFPYDGSFTPQSGHSHGERYHLKLPLDQTRQDYRNRFYFRFQIDLSTVVPRIGPVGAS